MGAGGGGGGGGGEEVQRTPTEAPFFLSGYNLGMWVWLKIEQEGLRRFWSMFPLTKGSILVPVF